MIRAAVDISEAAFQAYLRSDSLLVLNIVTLASHP